MKSKLLTPLALLLLALTWAQGAWADTDITNSADKDALTGINQNTRVDFGKGLINVYLNGSATPEATNSYISIISTNPAEKPVVTNDASPFYLKLGGALEVRFKLTEQATLDITYDESCKPDATTGMGGTTVYIIREDSKYASYTSRTEITSGVALQPGTYKITRISGATNISSFTLTTNPTPAAFVTDITNGAVLEHTKAQITGTSCKFEGGYLDCFGNNDYAEFKVSNTKEQYFKFSFKGSTALDGSSLEVIYLKANGNVITSETIEVSNNGSWTSYTNEYSYTSAVKIPTDVAKIKLVFHGSGYTVVNVRDLTLTPVQDPSPDKDATVVIYTVTPQIEADASPIFKTIQAAIEAVPAGKRGIIYVTPDKYETLVNTGAGTAGTNKYISITSDDKSTTVLSSNRHRGEGSTLSFRDCPALYVKTPRFYGENFTVKNTSTDGQAEALCTEGDGFVFNKSLIKGYQDTYRSTSSYRGYFTNSTIVGATDFVYAGGTVWFENSEFQCLKGGNGYIFSPEDAKGAEIMSSTNYPLLTSFNPLYTSFFVNECKITAEDGTTASSYYLGRPWSNGSGMLVMNSEIGKHIKADGWYPNGKDASKLTYLEYNNKQDATPTRPDWVKTPTADELTYFTPEFIFGHIGTTKFDHEEMLRGVNIPYDITTTITGSDETSTWGCSGAVGYALYKDGKFDRILTTNSFTRPASDDSYYAIRAISRYGAMTDAVGLGGKTRFMYELPVGFKPESDILSTQNGITMKWGTNTPSKRGGLHYMKPGATAFVLTGDFKEDDEIRLRICWVEGNTPGGFTFSEAGGVATDGVINFDGDAAPVNGKAYILTYKVKSDCSNITIRRKVDKNYYINNITIIRSKTITVKSAKTAMEVELGGIELSDVNPSTYLNNVGVFLPRIKGEVSDGTTYSGTPVYEDYDESVIRVVDNKIVPVSKGTTRIKVSYSAPGYTVIPCYIDVTVVGSCIRGIVATKNGTNHVISAVDSETFHPVTGVFEINGNLQCNMFYEGTEVTVTLGNPYTEGIVRVRYHVHDETGAENNYREEVYEQEIEPGSENNIKLPTFKNSFAIHTEHVVDGRIVGTKTYEFVYIDDMVYYVAQHGSEEGDLTVRVSQYGKITSTSGGTSSPEEYLSVNGLKMSYGGINETWKYAAPDGRDDGRNDDMAFTGRDGVLTYKGYAMSTQINAPAIEDSKNLYEHRDATSWVNGTTVRAAAISEGTFSLPVVGDYFRFEPERNGTIIVHVYQPGSTTITADGKKLANRPLYFVDEAGKSQKLVSYSTTSTVNFDEYNEVARYFYDYNLDKDDDDEHRRRMWNRYLIDRGYATLDPALPKIKPVTGVDYNIYEDEGKTIVKYGDGTILPTSEGLVKPQEVLVLHVAKAATVTERPNSALPDFISYRYNPDSEKATYPDDLIQTINNSEGNSKTQESMKDGTGYMLATGGFIKYAFDVKAGKTYILFTYASRLGFCGYEFVPKQEITEVDPSLSVKSAGDPNSKFVCNNIKASTSTITLDGDNASYDNIAALSGAVLGEQYDVTLNRTFTAGQWTPIVLPFSVSHSKLEELFGKDTPVLHFYNIEHKDHVYTLHLKKHYYDMIVAGTPVFIRPTFTGVSGTTSVLKDDTYVAQKSTFQFNNVTIEITNDDQLDPVTNCYSNEKIKNKNNTSGRMKSSLNADAITYMGLYISGNKFYQNRLSGGKTIAIKPLRGWIQTTEPVAAAPRLTNYMNEELDIDGDDDIATEIDIIEVDDGTERKTYSNSSIYTINGQKVGSSFTDLSTLPGGIYIVNGKKITVSNK